MNERVKLIVTGGHDLAAAKGHLRAIGEKFAFLRSSISEEIGFTQQEVTNLHRLNFRGFGREVLVQLVAKLDPSTASLVGEVLCVVSAPNFKPVICARFEVDSTGQTNVVNERGSMMHLSDRGDQARALLEHLLFNAVATPLEPQD